MNDIDIMNLTKVVLDKEFEAAFNTYLQGRIESYRNALEFGGTDNIEFNRGALRELRYLSQLKERVLAKRKENG